MDDTLFNKLLRSVRQGGRIRRMLNAKDAAFVAGMVESPPAPNALLVRAVARLEDRNAPPCDSIWYEWPYWGPNETKGPDGA